MFVDEFQDVSDDNFRLLKLILPERGGNLFAVGDDWQSIYGFRSARVEYIVRMKRLFPRGLGSPSHGQLSLPPGDRLAVRPLYPEEPVPHQEAPDGPSRQGRLRPAHCQSPPLRRRPAPSRSSLRGRAPGATLAVLFRNNWQCQYFRECGSALDRAGVSVMTMHASKGLEFDTVIVAGVRDGVIPDPESGIEEERRLLYVACTRARDELAVIAHVNDRGEMARFGRELGIAAPQS